MRKTQRGVALVAVSEIADRLGLPDDVQIVGLSFRPETNEAVLNLRSSEDGRFPPISDGHEPRFLPLHELGYVVPQGDK